MIDSGYHVEDGYHTGTPVEQNIRSLLGVFKRIDDVPERYYLGNYVTEVNAEDAWEEYTRAELTDVSEHTREYVYDKEWQEWQQYCRRHDMHPALVDPANVESHISEQRREMNTLQTVYTNRLRPLFRWYQWMLYHTDYPHRYSPVAMAVLRGGTAHDAWQYRLEGGSV